MNLWTKYLIALRVISLDGWIWSHPHTGALSIARPERRDAPKPSDARRSNQARKS